MTNDLKSIVDKQLRESGRVDDCGKFELELDRIINDAYELSRIRESVTGMACKTIDCFCGPIAAAEFSGMMLKRYDSQFGIKSNDLMLSGTSVGIPWVKFSIPETGISLAIMATQSERNWCMIDLSDVISEKCIFVETPDRHKCYENFSRVADGKCIEVVA